MAWPEQVESEGGGDPRKESQRCIQEFWVKSPRSIPQPEISKANPKQHGEEPERFLLLSVAGVKGLILAMSTVSIKKKKKNRYFSEEHNRMQNLSDGSWSLWTIQTY